MKSLMVVGKVNSSRADGCLSACWWSKQSGCCLDYHEMIYSEAGALEAGAAA